jgi:FkbM family methyltransferase
MQKFKYYLVKTLQKLNLLKSFNFNLSKTINSVKVKIPFINGSGLTNLVFKEDWLDTIIDKFINNESTTFIDVGVNVGQTLLRVKTKFSEINYLGFEPNSTCTSYAQKLIKMNLFSNSIIQNCALTDKVQNLVLEKTAVDDPRASVIKDLRPDYFEEKEFVLSLDYDSFYLDQKICFVKIDVEGGELEVIKGMKLSLKKHKPIIVCEVLDSHDKSVFEFTQKRATQLSDLLHSINYSIIKLETSSVLNKLVSFDKVETIILKQWTPKSYDLNDYLFYPEDIEQEVLSKIKGIVST